MYAAYLIVLLALIFVRGMAKVIQGCIDHRKGPRWRSFIDRLLERLA